MPMPIPPVLPVLHTPVRPAPQRREGGSTPWLVAILALIVASAFVVDVGVPAPAQPALQQTAMR